MRRGADGPAVGRDHARFGGRLAAIVQAACQDAAVARQAHRAAEGDQASAQRAGGIQQGGAVPGALRHLLPHGAAEGQGALPQGAQAQEEGVAQMAAEQQGVQSAPRSAGSGGAGIRCFPCRGFPGPQGGADGAAGGKVLQGKQVQGRLRGAYLRPRGVVLEEAARVARRPRRGQLAQLHPCLAFQPRQLQKGSAVSFRIQLKRSFPLPQIRSCLLDPSRRQRDTLQQPHQRNALMRLHGQISNLFSLRKNLPQALQPHVPARSHTGYPRQLH